MTVKEMPAVIYACTYTEDHLPNTTFFYWQPHNIFPEYQMKKYIRAEGHDLIPRAVADKLAQALDLSRCVIQFHVKPEKCVSIDGKTYSAENVFKQTLEALKEYEASK